MRYAHSSDKDEPLVLKKNQRDVELTCMCVQVTLSTSMVRVWE